ncbi:helix-turn-helix domain-containing protein [Acrocarpospora catenulata]|uniref:helix-turn-helix domain-containing protein n=1 Tax=Acrocarpospora catenulata TaxID=2836182 RepID=UPI001BDA295F|nr:helix-turn-helix transcriptional regulator [Acrocarpospora catenulata]
MTTGSPPHRNAFRAHLLACALRWWRETSQMSLRQVAAAIHTDHSHLAKMERGLRPTPPHVIDQLDRIYTANGQLVALHTAITRLHRESTPDLAFHTQGKDEDMERRQLLQLAAATAGLGALGAAGEPVRQLLDMTVNGPHRSIEDWELACADHLHAINTRPAAQVHDDLLADLVAMQRQLRSADSAHVVELHRITAVLAAFHASVLVRLGEPGSALRWYRTARNAADTSGDLDLRLRIRAHEAEHSASGLRDATTTLHLIENALQIAGTAVRPSVGQVSLIRAKAKTLALLGRHDEARHMLQTLLDLVAKSDLPAVPGFWEPADYRIYVTKSQVLSAAGDEAGSSRAQEHVLTGSPAGHHIAVNIRLHAAHCTVVNGGIDEGMRQAATVIDSVPGPYRNIMIMETARRVFNAVPIAQRERPVVGEFREVLALTPASS